jgi:hypothetical protein
MWPYSPDVLQLLLVIPREGDSTEVVIDTSGQLGTDTVEALEEEDGTISDGESPECGSVIGSGEERVMPRLVRPTLEVSKEVNGVRGVVGPDRVDTQLSES